MRFSTQPRFVPAFSKAASNADFFREVASACSSERGRASILLVGARDLRAIAVRRAQAPLRYDRRSSYFSHAALITKWSAAQPENSLGLEASLDPDPSETPVPERNGVTSFRLKRYLDEKVYPNLAIISLELKPTVRLDAEGKATQMTSVERKDELLDAACNPCRERETYALWDGLGAWAKYRYSPERTTNPLLDNLPLPAAAYCEYVYGSQQIDIIPGAIARQTCPELLWATFLRWQQGLLATAIADLTIDAVIRDEHGIAPDPLPMEITGVAE